MNSLTEKIRDWNQTHVQELQTIHAEFSFRDGFIDEIIQLFSDPSCQTGATWLLKHSLEEQKTLSDPQIQSFLKKLSALKDWQSKLHALQCLPYLKLPNSADTSLLPFLKECIEDKNKFVRAWACHGFYELAQVLPGFRESCFLLLNEKMSEEAPSIQARIRKTLKLIEKNW